MTKRELTAEVKRLIPCTRFLTKSKSGLYICPICHSGTGKNKTGALQYYPATNTCFCRGGCGGKKYNPISLYMGIYNITDFETARDTLAEEVGIDTGGKKETTAERRAREEKQRKYKEKREKELAEAQAKAEEEEKKAANYDFTAYYKACRARLDDPEALAYLNGRGISKETAYNCFIGYDPQADPAGVPGALGDEHRPHPCKRIIAPTTKKHYIGRSIQTDTAEAYIKMNPKGASPGIFNKSRLAADVPEVFVTEGFFDALSVEEVGAAAVSLNSTSNTEKLLKAIREQPTGATLVLCLDNDAAGENKTKPLQEGLQALGGYCICANIAGSYNDPNEALQKDKEAFIKAVKEAQEQARAYRKEAEEMTGEKNAQQMQNAQELQEVETAQEVQKPQEKGEAAADQRAEGTGEATQQERNGDQAPKYVPPFTGLYEAEFMQYCQTEQHPISTGIIGLDIALKGGLTDELYLLGAETGQGKSALSLNIAENIARAGTDVLYFALEMSRKELIARGISSLSWREREKYKDTGAPISAGDIMYFDYDYTLKGFYKIPAKRYEKQAAQYFKECGGHLAIIENSINGRTAEGIAHLIRLHIETTGRKPVVFVDYLQMIAGDPNDRTQADRKSKTDAAIRTLKQISIKYKVPVFGISSLNRIGYGKRVTSASFKESGDLEYTAGVLLGLNLDAQMENYGSDKEAEITIKAALNPGKDKPRKMTLEVMKFRNGERANDVKLDYFATYNCFMMREEFTTITAEQKKDLPFPDNKQMTIEEYAKNRNKRK